MNESALELGALTEGELLGHGAWIRRFCTALVGPEEGEDLAQETWVAALQRRDPLDRREAARPWLASVARNLALNRWRRRARRGETALTAAPADADSSTDEVVERGELTRLVVECVMKLSEPSRTTLLLRYFEELDSFAIADRMEVTPAAVRSRLRRGLEEVRERLDRRHRGDRTSWMGALVPVIAPVDRLRSVRTPTLLPSVVIGFATLLLAVVWFGRGPSDATPALLSGSASASAESSTEVSPDETVAHAVAPAQRTALEPAPRPAAPLQVSSVRWSRPAPDWIHAWVDKRLLAPPLVVGDVVVTGGQRLQCFRLADGDLQWAVDGGNQAFGWVPPRAVVGESLIAKHTQGGVAAFALETGELLWRRSQEELGSDAVAGLVARTRSGEQRYLTGTASGVAALDPHNGQTLWRLDLGGAAVGLAVDGGDIITGSLAGQLVALDAQDGSIRWSSQLVTPLSADQPPLCFGETVITLTFQKYGNPSSLEAFDRGTGRRLWSRTLKGTFGQLVTAQNEVWIALPSGFVPIQMTDGELLEERTLRTSQPPLGPTSVHGDIWLYASRDGSSALYAYDQRAQEGSWSFQPVKGTPVEIFGWSEYDGGLLVTAREGLFALERARNGSELELGTRIVGKTERNEQSAETNHEDGPTHEVSFENAHVLASWIEEDAGDESESGAGWPERRAALEDYLSGSDPTRRRAALLAIASIAKRKGDDRRDELLPLQARIAELVLEDFATVRVAALKAWVALGSDHEPALFHAGWGELELTDRVGLLPELASLSAGLVEGPSEELVFELLQEVHGRAAYRCVQELRKVELSDRLSQRLLELSPR